MSTESSEENSSGSLSATSITSKASIPQGSIADTSEQKTDIEFEDNDIDILLAYSDELDIELETVDDENFLWKLALAEYYRLSGEHKPFYDMTTLEEEKFTKQYEVTLEKYGIVHKRDKLLEEDINAKKSVIDKEYDERRAEIQGLQEGIYSFDKKEIIKLFC
jgi:hypothetical protein